MKNRKRFHGDGTMPTEILSHSLRLLSDPSRARILDALLGGLPLSAGELAYRCRLSPPALSSHLGKLKRGGMIAGVKAGRQNFYELRSARVARKIEQLTQMLLPELPNACPAHLRNGRFCYDHLAGRLGLFLLEQMIEKKWLMRKEQGFAINKAGHKAFMALGVDLQELEKSKRRLTRICMDWSERKPHLAGSLGAAIPQAFLKKNWIQRDGDSRAVYVCSSAIPGFAEWLGIQPQKLEIFTSLPARPGGK